ncbi:MAG: hypothetical protein K2J31_06365, partial [Alistipes sp.]|nr:hypothetical protein [Alistipes sp.]
MKRLLLLAAAMCCISLVSCDNEQDLGKFSPEDLEILEMNELISSQSGFDEEALVADLLNGTMKMTAHYLMIDGKAEKAIPMGGPSPCIQTLFFEDGTCKDCRTINPIGENGTPSGWIDTYAEYDWRYDSSSHSIITHDTSYGISYDGTILYHDECRIKVLYYNTDNHRLILEGHIFNLDAHIIRMTGYIDIDPAECERI